MNGNSNYLSISFPEILIVEDNIDFLNSLYKNLIKLTSNIKITTNGKSALNVIKKYKPSILLLDLKMPGMNGVELLSKIRENDIKVIIISGEIELLNYISVEYYNMISCVLIKPIDMKRLYYNVNFLLLEQEKTRNFKKLKRILDEFEFNKSSNGYIYLVESLKEICYNPEKIKNIEKLVYTTVASKHGIDNINRIKWCIIKSLKSMYRYTDKKIFLKYFIDTERITPKNFIVEIYNIMKNGEVLYE